MSSDQGSDNLVVIPPDELVGQAIGNYKITAELGRGGMGVVYVAEHVSIGKKAAVKVLLPRFSAKPDIVQRFFNEAKAAAMIQHPGIVEVFDFGKLESGAAYLIMEYLAGESLTARLKRGGPMPLGELVNVAKQTAAAVGAAHDKQIVHRDLKPDNVFLLPDEHMPLGVRVKILDFGIAKLADEGEADEVKTQAGEMLGTPNYMSPEQCRGAGEVDARADVYSLGCIVYEMATGTVPFDVKGTGAVIAAHIYEEPPPPRTIDASLPAALETVILRALAKEPKDRPQSMEALAEELEATLKTSAAANPPAPSTPAQPTVTGSGSGSGTGSGSGSGSGTGSGTGSGSGSGTGAGQMLFTSAERKKKSATLAYGIGAVAAAALVIGYLATRGGDEGGSKAVTPPTAADAAVARVLPPDATPPPPPDCNAGDAADCLAKADAAAAGGDLAGAGALRKKACEGGAAAACAPAGVWLGAAPAPDLAGAVALFQKGCEAGDRPACVQLAWATESGRGVERDLTRAFALYLEACDKKDADACARLAAMYEDGKGVTTDTSKALGLYLRACDAGSGAGCTGLGVLTSMGQGVAIDPAKAYAAFVKGCAAGDALGCLRAGRAEQRGLGVDADQGKAAARWDAILGRSPARCEAGDPRDCQTLGVVTLQGLGGKADVGRGVSLVRRACELGWARACSEASALLAIYVPNDPGARDLVERACAGGDDLGCALAARPLLGGADADKAVELLEKACAGGGENGCADLAGLYDSGAGVPKDAGRATGYLRRACDGGSFRGCIGLGLRLADGSAGRKDERRARLAAEKACALEPMACWLHARFLASGIGGAADVGRAKELYARACAAGEESACPLKDQPLPPDAGVPVPMAGDLADAGP